MPSQVVRRGRIDRRAPISLAAIAATLLAGCAGLGEVESQQVAVRTTPDGANCALSINGRIVGRVRATPGSADIPKSSHPLRIVCERAGYLDAEYISTAGAPSIGDPETVVDGLIALALDGDFYARGEHVSVAELVLERDPALPATLDEVAPVEPVTVQTSTVPVSR